jgi:hypothetical protein
MSFAFSNLVLTIDDIEPLVAQKTVTLLETLSDQAVKSILSCFELQFDCVIADRLFLNKIINKFYSCMLAINNNKSTTLSWEFFLQRFNSISMETQLVNDILSPVDISGVNVNNNNTQRKINMAHLALKRSDLIKSVTADLQHVFNPNIFHYKMSQTEKPVQNKRKYRFDSISIHIIFNKKKYLFCLLGSSSKTPKSAKGTPVKLKKGEDPFDTGVSNSKTDTDKNSKEATASTNTAGKAKYKEGGGMSSGVESDNTQTNANSTPEETDVELATNDGEVTDTNANDTSKSKEAPKTVTIEESNVSNDANSEVVDTAKEQETMNNEILHSLITLLMKVRMCFWSEKLGFIF